VNHTYNYVCVTRCRIKNIPLNGTMLIEKTNEYAQKLAKETRYLELEIRHVESVIIMRTRTIPISPCR